MILILNDKRGCDMCLFGIPQKETLYEICISFGTVYQGEPSV